MLVFRGHGGGENRSTRGNLPTRAEHRARAAAVATVRYTSALPKPLIY